MVSVSRSLSGNYAEVYYPCLTLKNKHRPVCTYRAEFYGKYLDVTDNPDVWHPLADVGSISYASRNLTIATTTGAATEARVVINTTAYSYQANFLEATFKIVGGATGAGGVRNTFFGFASALSAFPEVERAGFQIDSSGNTYLVYRGGSVALSGLSLGRNLAAGDIITVRLDRQDGSANIDIIEWYVNGQRQYTSLSIPQANCYCGLGVYCDADCSTARTVIIDYFGFEYVP